MLERLELRAMHLFATKCDWIAGSRAAGQVPKNDVHVEWDWATRRRKGYRLNTDVKQDAWFSWDGKWEAKVRRLTEAAMQGADAGHDLAHVERVVRAARIIGQAEGADPAVVLPAAWLHDCIAVAKDSPLRNQASKLAADQACVWLEEISYPPELLEKIHHAILAHSFSAGIPPQSIEAKVVQDADRLEAVGALGLARCLMTGGAMRRRLLHPTEPFPVVRQANDAESSLDHLFVKLFKLPAMMQTATVKRLRHEELLF